MNMGTPILLASSFRIGLHHGQPMFWWQQSWRSLCITNSGGKAWTTFPWHCSRFLIALCKTTRFQLSLIVWCALSQRVFCCQGPGPASWRWPTENTENTTVKSVTRETSSGQMVWLECKPVTTDSLTVTFLDTSIDSRSSRAEAETI